MAGIENAFQECITSMTLSISQAQSIVQKFDSEIEEALYQRGKGKKYDIAENSIKCCDAFSSAIPTGNETGNYYAIDFGGSNLRAVCMKLDGKGGCETQVKKMSLRDAHITSACPMGILDKNCPATTMFNTIAELVKELMIEVGDNPEENHEVAFCFSFPVQQFGIKNGILMEWTKQFQTGCSTKDPVEGQDVAELLNAAFKRANMGAEVGCLINDTVGTMLSAAYQNSLKLPTCRVGVILGTGFNIAMADLKAPSMGYNGTLINLECGNFNKLREFLTVVDIELDYNSNNPGMQMAEKVISGNYICEMVRLWFIKVFQHRCTESVWKPFSIKTEQCAEIFMDYTKTYKKTRRVMKSVFNWEISDQDHLRMIYKIVCAVFDRSATLAAIMTFTCAHRTRYLQKGLGGVTVGIDGSLYLCNDRYRKIFEKALNRLLNNRIGLLHCVSADDGSGKGAAIMAACTKCQS